MNEDPYAPPRRRRRGRSDLACNSLVDLDSPRYSETILEALEEVLPDLAGCPQENIDEAHLAIRRYS